MLLREDNASYTHGVVSMLIEIDKKDELIHLQLHLLTLRNEWFKVEEATAEHLSFCNSCDDKFGSG